MSVLLYPSIVTHYCQQPASPPVRLQVQACKPDAQAGQKPVNNLLHEFEEVVHHGFQAEQQSGERGDEGVQGAEQGT